MADPIDRVAAAVTDGADVDWVREKSRRPHLLEPLEQLAIVERIRRTHESTDPAGSPDTPPDDETKTVDLPPATRDREAVSFQWGQIEVFEKVGEGGGGEVYRARDTSLNAEVALKLLRPDHADSHQLVGRFLEEARRLARVHHPNVLIVHGADQHDGRVGLWTEFVRGKSLEASLAEQGPLSACEAALIGLDLCRALAAVHAAGLIHRDVKTTNVMRQDGGRIVLMDFGTVVETPGGVGRWNAGTEGTPICMAPEQLHGEVAGPATDIYGLGVLLYRLVTRQYPVEARSLGELSEKHSSGEHVPLRDRRPDLPLEFVQVVERALRADPAERYPSVGAMEQDLALTLGAMARREVRRRRGQRIAFATVAAGAVVAGVVIGLVIPGPEPAPKPGPPVGTNVVLTPPVPAPLSAEAQLVRYSEGRAEALAPGDRIKPDDLLSLLIKSSDSMYVYVLDKDAGGEVNGLFPLEGVVPSNPLSGRMQHRLPGDRGDEPFWWNVTSATGRESIIAIGSRRPLEDLQAAMKEISSAGQDQGVRFWKVDPMKFRTFRGITEGRSVPPTADEAKRRLDAALDGLREEARATGNVWVWSIELENPPVDP